MTMMRGHQLKLKLGALCKRHGFTPVERSPIALLSPATVRQIIEGIAATPDVDSDRMSFARGSLSWPALDQLPLLVRHNADKSAGKILDLTCSAEGRLTVKARVDDQEARCMPAFSIAATVIEAEIVNEDSFAFHALIHRATIDEISLTDRPANPNAVVISRRDVTSMDTAHDAALAAAVRAHAALEKLRAALSAPKPAPPSSPALPRTAPARIYGSLPRAIVSPRQTAFSRLVARLPVGGS